MGIIEDGYYYPDAEDIRIGWEGEVNWSRGYCEVYDPIKVKLENDDYTPCKDLQNILELAIWDRCAEVRCKLLTKEDILLVGWVHTGTFWYEWPNKDIDCEEISNRSLDWRLNWVNNEKAILIDFYERNSFEWFRGYEGPCPTINELRVIMNLLKIK